MPTEKNLESRPSRIDFKSTAAPTVPLTASLTATPREEPVPREPWDDRSNRPIHEEPQAYWENTGYLGETSEHATHTYVPHADLISNESLFAEVCEALGASASVDATDVSVQVHDGIVILTGSVLDQHMKHEAEITAYAVAGVTQVQNELSFAH